MKKRALVWFKTDLRIQDNETLIRAIETHEEVVPVYCLDRHMVEGSYLGFPRIGMFRLKFLLESLLDLDAQLRQLNSGLLLVYGYPEIEIPALAKRFEVQSVYAKKEVAIEEQQLDLKVEQTLWKLPCTLELVSTSTLYRAEDLPFSIKEIPDTFTAFRKAIESESSVRKLIPGPSEIHSPEIPVLEIPEEIKRVIKNVSLDDRSAFPFTGGETEFWKRLKHCFFESALLANYKEIRNGMVGPDYSSKFSAWLSLGCVSPRSIYFQVKKYESEIGKNDSTYWFVFELLWRDFFRFMFKKHHQKYFLPNGIRTIKKAIGAINQDLIQNWIKGKTGNDFVDANMQELALTGFMSNRGRQNVASYFCHDLKLDWRYGAAYFESMLLDYDPCSNWGNWAYIAGVGNDPVANRKFNLENQAHEYDYKGAYRKLWLNL